MKIYLLLSCGSTLVSAWVSHTKLPAHPGSIRISSASSSRKTTTTSLSEASYTKGAEIFPLCNKKGYTLADSFPNGVIPSMAQTVLNEKAPNLTRAMEIQGDEVSESSSRRNFILLASSAAAATASSQYFLNSDSSSGSTTPAAFTEAMDIPQAIQWIDDNCDRRYLHAVIASDYKFLYRGVTNLGPKEIRMERPKPDLLSEETYGSAQALDFFQNVQQVLEKDAVNPTNGHLATSSAKDATEWGVAGSIWPVNGSHYAWFQDGGLFYPRPNNSAVVAREDLIVDGKDCGKESLEDALRSDSCEVMVASEQFLVVPASLDEKLREALQGSFLV